MPSVLKAVGAEHFQIVSIEKFVAACLENAAVDFYGDTKQHSEFLIRASADHRQPSPDQLFHSRVEAF